MIEGSSYKERVPRHSYTLTEVTGVYQSICQALAFLSLSTAESCSSYSHHLLILLL